MNALVGFPVGPSGILVGSSSKALAGSPTPCGCVGFVIAAWWVQRSSSPPLRGCVDLVASAVKVKGVLGGPSRVPVGPRGGLGGSSSSSKAIEGSPAAVRMYGLMKSSSSAVPLLQAQTLGIDSSTQWTRVSYLQVQQGALQCPTLSSSARMVLPERALRTVSRIVSLSLRQPYDVPSGVPNGVRERAFRNVERSSERRSVRAKGGAYSGRCC